MSYKSHDQYIASFNDEIQFKLIEFKSYLKKLLPKNCEEIISYNMPAFKLKQIVVYFAAHKNHIGFYPTSKPIKFFKEELKNVKHSKGAIQLPYNSSIPEELIKKIVEFRLKELGF